MKTDDLEGSALDWAVAKSLGDVRMADIRMPAWKGAGLTLWLRDDEGKLTRMYATGTLAYHSHWDKAGPIITRERIDIAWSEDGWYANMYWRGLDVIPAGAAGSSFRFGGDGPTPLIAAMRCFVKSRLGKVVALPKGLL